MSGAQLAIAVGYKNQSSIGNLENTGKGVGGKKLPEIARALRVPLAWLAEGPDGEEIPFTEPLIPGTVATHSTLASDLAAGGYSVDASLMEAVELFKQLRTEQRLKTINYMREILTGTDTGTNQTNVGESDSVPHVKAA